MMVSNRWCSEKLNTTSSLFERSEPFSETSKQRFTLEKDGSIHRFIPSNKEQTLWHWTGSTTDKNAPLNLSRSE